MIPQYQTNQAAGADLAASETVTIEPGQVRLVGTGYALDNITASQGGAFLLFARSSLALKRGLMLANGVGLIDPDYRDEIKVMLYNASADPVTVHKGERIAQLVAISPGSVNYLMVWPVKDSERQGGFGSTGQ